MTVVAETLGVLRTHIHSSAELDSSSWPGLVETGALLLSLNVESEVSLPFSWVAASIFRDLLASLQTEAATSADTYSRPDDKMLLRAMHTSLAVLAELSGVTAEQMAKIGAAFTQQIAAKIRQTPKKFRRAVLKGSRGVGSDSYQMVSPAGHLEKLVALEEMAADQAAADAHLVAGGTRDVREKVKASEASLRLRVLRSDFMLDFVERIMK